MCEERAREEEEEDKAKEEEEEILKKRKKYKIHIKTERNSKRKEEKKKVNFCFQFWEFPNMKFLSKVSLSAQIFSLSCLPSQDVWIGSVGGIHCVTPHSSSIHFIASKSKSSNFSEDFLF